MLSCCVQSYRTVDAFNNMSDHEPVHLMLNLPTDAGLGKALLACRTCTSYSCINTGSTDPDLFNSL